MKRLTILMALAGCVQNQPFHPVTVKAPADAFAKASRVLIEQGASIETKDEPAGILLTKWEDETRMGTLYRYRWNITITNGDATVNSQCQFKMESSGPVRNDWQPCDVQPPDRGDRAKAIADAIAR